MWSWEGLEWLRQLAGIRGKAFDVRAVVEHCLLAGISEGMAF